jgi:hypothetical protein
MTWALDRLSRSLRWMRLAHVAKLLLVTGVLVLLENEPSNRNRESRASRWLNSMIRVMTEG